MEDKKSVETLLSVDQVVFHFKLNDNTSMYLNKKYKGELHSLKDWKIIFTKDGLKTKNN